MVYYGYDDLRRLTAETWNDAGGLTIYGFAWNYDPAGNRTYQSKDLGGTATHTYYTYDVADELTRLHELPADEWTYFGYDRNGSLVSRQEPAGTTYFAYADHGLVESIAPPTGNPVYFHYDGRLTRTAMTQGAETTYFTWDEDRLRMLELRTDGETRRLTHGHSPIDGIGTVVEEEVVGGERYYHHLDHRGTTYKITRGSDGAVVWSGQVNAWGEELAESGASPSIFWYQGEAWFGVEVGGRRYYVSPTRVYDAEDGRFVGRDALTSARPLYTYALCRPTILVDPTGLASRQAVETGDLEYSCRCGWIDWTHVAAVDEMKALWESIRDEKGPKVRLNGGAAGFEVSYSQDMHQPHPKRWWAMAEASGRFAVKTGLTKEQKKSVALSIMRKVTEAFEEMQGEFPFGFVTGHSSFSGEDLPSNEIAFYMAVEGYDRDDIRELCEGLGTDEGGIKKSLDVWDADGEPGKMTRWDRWRRRTCSECTGKETWPSKLWAIKPAPPGKLYELREPVSEVLRLRLKMPRLRWPRAIDFPGGLFAPPAIVPDRPGDPRMPDLIA